jgi:tetratricopeptide (TPR) repeat protein
MRSPGRESPSPNTFFDIPERREEARRHYRDVIGMRERLDDPRIALKTEVNLMVLERKAGNYREALALAGDLASASRRFAWKEGEAMAYWTLADVQTDLQEPRMAAKYLQETYERLLVVGNLSWASIALSDLASAELASGRTEMAMRHHRRAVELSRDRLDPYWLARLLLFPVRELLARDLVPEAERYVREAQRVLPAWRDYTSVVCTAARVKLAQHEPAAAWELVRDSQPATDDSRWQASVLRGECLRALGRPSEAAVELSRAAEMIEEDRALLPIDLVGRAAYVADKLDVYRSWAGALVDAGRPREAFVTAERMRFAIPSRVSRARPRRPLRVDECRGEGRRSATSTTASSV